MLLEVTYGNDGDELLPLGGPGLIVFEQALVHAGAEQVREAGGGGVGLSDAVDGRLFGDGDAAERAVLREAVVERGVACDACVSLAYTAEAANVAHLARINVQLKHAVERCLDLLGFGDLRADIKLLVGVAAHDPLLRELGQQSPAGAYLVF